MKSLVHNETDGWKSMKNVIMDVDTGVDDALGIIMAIKSRKLNVLGITTVAGNVGAKQAAINTKKILYFLNEMNIPVLSGSETSYRGEYITGSNIHGIDGLFGALGDVKIEMNEIHEGEAVEYLVETITKYKDKGITLILTAPLTNLALALERAPYIKEFIEEAIIMGGAVECPGNITPYAEFNIYKDPEAADLVMNSGIRITMVTLDVTNKVILKKDHIKKIINTNLKGLVSSITEPWINRYKNKYGIEGCLVHDPLTVAYAIDRTIIKTRRTNIDVVKGDASHRGKLESKDDGPSCINVSIEVDDVKFEKLFLECLNI